MKRVPLIKGDIEFSVIESRNVVKDKTIQYFSDSGYKLVKEKENLLFFTRGSVFLNGFTFNPLQWMSKVKVRIRDNRVYVTLLVNTEKQIVTQREYDLWLLFMENYEKFLQEGVDYKEINRSAKNKVKREGVKFLFLMMLSGVACLALGAYLLTLTDCAFFLLLSLILFLFSMFFLLKKML